MAFREVDKNLRGSEFEPQFAGGICERQLRGVSKQTRPAQRKRGQSLPLSVKMKVMKSVFILHSDLFSCITFRVNNNYYVKLTL